MFLLEKVVSQNEEFSNQLKNLKKISWDKCCIVAWIRIEKKSLPLDSHKNECGSKTKCTVYSVVLVPNFGIGFVPG